MRERREKVQGTEGIKEKHLRGGHGVYIRSGLRAETVQKK